MCHAGKKLAEGAAAAESVSAQLQVVLPSLKATLKASSTNLTGASKHPESIFTGEQIVAALSDGAFDPVLTCCRI